MNDSVRNVLVLLLLVDCFSALGVWALSRNEDRYGSAFTLAYAALPIAAIAVALAAYGNSQAQRRTPAGSRGHAGYRVVFLAHGIAYVALCVAACFGKVLDPFGKP